jgi:hypothetical protein
MNKQELLDLLSTRKKLRWDYVKEPDPRVKQDIAETLDMIECMIDGCIIKLLDKVA